MSRADRERRQERERNERAAAELKRQREEADAAAEPDAAPAPEATADTVPPSEPTETAPEPSTEPTEVDGPDPAEVWAGVKAKIGATPDGDGWSSAQIGGVTVGIGPTITLAPEPYDPLRDAARYLAGLAQQAFAASDGSDEQRAALDEIPRFLLALPAVLGEDLWYALRWIAEQETDPALRVGSRHAPDLDVLRALVATEIAATFDGKVEAAEPGKPIVLLVLGRLALATIDAEALEDNAKSHASGRSPRGARVRVTGGPFTGRRGTLAGHEEADDGTVKSYLVRLDVDVEIADGKASKIEPAIEVSLVPRWLIPISTGAAIVRVRGNDGPHPYVKRPYPPAVSYGDRSEAYRFETYEAAGGWCDGATAFGVACWIEPAPERVSLTAR